MKAFLMHRSDDFEIGSLPSHEGALVQDLELDILFNAMANGDDVLFEVAKAAALSGVRSPEETIYRQDILRDCLRHPTTVTQMYAIAVQSIRDEKRIYRSIFSSPSYIVHRSIEAMESFLGTLKRLRHIADEHAGEFTSEGFTRLFAMLTEELGDGYFAAVEDHLKRLRFKDGVLVSAQLGEGNVGIGYVLRAGGGQRRGLLRHLPAKGKPGFTLTIPDRDEGGARTLSQLRDRGLNLAANALAQSVDHILGFFNMLRRELGFYVGCLNLHAQLTGKGQPVCFPVPADRGTLALSFRELRDTCLALSASKPVVGNDADADGKSLVVITGANQGGKSTFLRSVGLAQLMMQCGMFVCAESFRASVCDALFTHYKREEDATMTSGKLDEELSRMSDIVDGLTPGCMLLCNESFASTNEREGSEIARQIIRALVDSDVRVLVVTHMFDLADGFYQQRMEHALFLRAERATGGHLSFRLRDGKPLPTSHAEDVYKRLFDGASLAAPAAGLRLPRPDSAIGQ
jgi:MutS domain V